jgi:hypothetical protein
VSPLTLTKEPERHIRCNPAIAQFIRDEAFEPVRCEGVFAKENLDQTFVAEQTERWTRGWRRLQAIPSLGIAIPEYPLPEVLEKWRKSS